MVNLAVGLIGSENNPANLLYGGVLAVGIVGAILARTKAQGMARALFATALAQALVPVLAIIIWKPQITPEMIGVLFLNGIFVLLFVGSGLLYQRAGIANTK